MVKAVRCARWERGTDSDVCKAGRRRRQQDVLRPEKPVATVFTVSAWRWQGIVPEESVQESENTDLQRVRQSVDTRWTGSGVHTNVNMEGTGEMQSFGTTVGEAESASRAVVEGARHADEAG
eukprot:3459530-Pleurochrysis_carterae.AAC.2